MKRTFSSHSEVCHVWAHQSQSEGHANNIFFQASTIYSYGNHFAMAKFIRPDVVLYNYNGYSSSTAKHQSHVRNALGSSVQIINVYDPEYSFTHNLPYMQERIKPLALKLVKAKSLHHYYLREIQSIIDDIMAYAKIVRKLSKVPKSIKEMAAMSEDELLTKLTGISGLGTKLAKKAKERANKLRIEAQSQLKLWLNYHIDSISYNHQSVLKYDYIRIRSRVNRDIPEDEYKVEIETTRNATVPLDQAKTLFHFIQKLNGHAWQSNGEQFKIGYYSVNRITADGDLIAGCHKIQRSEINRFAKTQNWI